MKKDLFRAIDISYFTQESQEVVKSFICGMCKGIYSDPYVDNCSSAENSEGHVYCHSCILSGRNCPKSNNKIQIEKAVSVKILQDIISRQNIYCTNRETGCDWIGPLIDRSNHISQCPKAMTKCKNQGCEIKIIRELIWEHERVCDYRLTACEKCNQLILNKEKETHKNDCLMEEVECAKKCGMILLRNDLKDHNSICNNEIVKCEFHNFGCNHQCLRKQLSEHITNNPERHYTELLRSIINMKTDIEMKVIQYEKLAIDTRQKIEQLDIYLSMDISDTETTEKPKGIKRLGRIKAINYEEVSEENYEDNTVLKPDGNKTNPIVLSDSEIEDQSLGVPMPFNYHFINRKINYTNIVKWKLSITNLKPEHEFYTGVCIQEILKRNEFKCIDTDEESTGIFGVSSTGILIHHTQRFRHNTKVDFCIRKGDVIICEFDPTRRTLTMSIKGGLNILLEQISSDLADYTIMPFYLTNKDPSIVIHPELM
jgi:hypothetical protein